MDALLGRCSSGDRQAFDQLYSLFYQDIRAIAVRELRNERHATIRPTALVHETYLRMVKLREIRWADRAHLLAMAARVTRQALVDEARHRRADKRDGGSPVTLSDSNLGGADNGYDALDVDDLLNELSNYDPVAAQIVSLRVFGGLSVDETADHLSISHATAYRHWSTGKAWLLHELSRL